MKQKTKRTALLFALIFSLTGGYILLQGSRAATLAGDVNGDGVVNISDLSILLSNFGKTGTNTTGDLNGSAKVDISDLSILLSNFGKKIAPTNSGQFTVSGTKIIDPAGQEFVPMGANFIGPNKTFYKQTLNYSLPILRDQWKINTMRINTCLSTGCDYNKASNTIYHGSDDLDAIVKKYTDAGMVVMIDLHQTPFGGWPADAKKYDANGNVIGTYSGNTSINVIRDWWIQTANKYKDNPYVWFELINEPGNPTGSQGSGAFYTWRDVHKDLVSAVRGTGATNIVIAEGTYWGQEMPRADGNFAKVSESAILRYGKEVAANYSNIAFAFHPYGTWGPTSLTDAQRDARMADYIDKVYSIVGHPLIATETGSLNFQQPEEIVPILQSQLAAEKAKPIAEQNADKIAMFTDRVGRIPTETAGTKTTYRVAPGKGVGVIAYAGFSNKTNDYSLIMPGKDANGNYLVNKSYWGDEFDMVNINNPINPTNLSWHGQLLWNATRNADRAPAR